MGIVTSFSLTPGFSPVLADACGRVNVSTVSPLVKAVKTAGAFAWGSLVTGLKSGVNKREST
jgi:hypothetical protein